MLLPVMRPFCLCRATNSLGNDLSCLGVPMGLLWPIAQLNATYSWQCNLHLVIRYVKLKNIHLDHLCTYMYVFLFALFYFILFFFPLRLFLTILCSMYFYMNIKFVFLFSMKNCVRMLMGIELNL